MEKRLYVIEIKEGVNDYVQGRISGMISAICPDSQPYTHRCSYETSDGLFKTKKLASIQMRVDATEDEFLKLRKIIEGFYPNLCAFYKEKV